MPHGKTAETIRSTGQPLTGTEASKAAFLTVKNHLTENLESREEFVKALQQAGKNPSKRMIAQLWTPDTSSISYAKFVEILRQIPDNSEDDLLKAFKKIDKNKDGFISFLELKNVLQKKGENLTDEEIGQIFTNADSNSDRRMDYAEFVHMVSSTMADTRQAAIRHLKRRDRQEALQQRAEHRQEHKRSKRQSLVEQSDTGGKLTRDARSGMQNGIAQQDNSGAIIARMPTISPNKRRPVPQQLEKWHHVQRKGCFYFDQPDTIVSHQYTLLLAHDDHVWITMEPTVKAETAVSMDTIFFLQDTKQRVVHTAQNKLPEGSYCLKCDLPAGAYRLLPFTSGCRFKPRSVPFKPSAALLEAGKDGAAKLTKHYRMALLNVFDQCDLDGDGQLSREEFNMYNVRTGDEQVTDAEWSVVQENFDTKGDRLTVKGFVQMHQLEADDNPSDVEDMWLSLKAMGINGALEIDEACPFVLNVHSESYKIELAPLEIQPLTSQHRSAIAVFMLERADLMYAEATLRLHAYQTDYLVALLLENTGSSLERRRIAINDPSNIVVSPSSIADIAVTSLPKSLQTICFLLPRNESVEWRFKPNITTEV